MKKEDDSKLMYCIKYIRMKWGADESFEFHEQCFNYFNDPDDNSFYWYDLDCSNCNSTDTKSLNGKTYMCMSCEHYFKKP